MTEKGSYSLLTFDGESAEDDVEISTYYDAKYSIYPKRKKKTMQDSKLPRHSIVALTLDYIEHKKLPQTLEMWDGSGRSIYVVNAYHAMHFVVTLIPIQTIIIGFVES
ncbi:hypothetical protein GQ43DRAFT_436284 [Delitschia confertaspora ATCC 74209]|uniref:Uncharacterized protein n=1 Tax=Delitschia confertaspora ATCC 74209 TaxID=1513339 RepID=A0A9P4JGK6_9PLEO|nr:hypothetical protein GQ43DRAFT_436284 [Delitschia confertaspora ATCC 74209]